jgi:hypothetical protein
MQVHNSNSNITSDGLPRCETVYGFAGAGFPGLLHRCENSATAWETLLREKVSPEAWAHQSVNRRVCDTCLERHSDAKRRRKRGDELTDDE